MLVKMFNRYFFQRSKFVETCIVNENVEFSKSLLRFREKMIYIFLICHIGLDRY